MIEMLKKTVSVNVRMSVVRVPPGRRFSVCIDGSRRTCAIVQVINKTSISYIVEVARPDDWSISTLILRPMNQLSFTLIERSIKQLLDGLVQKGGHWDQSVLNQCSDMNIEKVKHYQNDSLRDWASRMSIRLLS
ncbi:hypothetical protein K0T92_16295 [Paenibacillus oenotherae]|uniref:TnsE C-terminal domain-containing protein n=1 Tax=Paenibacillus oenotherae TaxID=1435645 RepID=A0ABS7D8M7_9BACL|nr:Tn7-like element transposition protein TnsE [Paenibacillus oenotherae]MBW7476294.1 hypothetical protein [Paenibacillus oenotherae]